LEDYVWPACEEVLEAPLYLEVTECPAIDDGFGRCIVGVGHIKICDPLPPGWTEAVHDDDDLRDQLSSITAIGHMADEGYGNYHMFSSSEETKGLWSGSFTWRVFYCKGYGASHQESPSAPEPSSSSAGGGALASVGVGVYGELE
jgi:hypothetical protein